MPGWMKTDAEVDAEKLAAAKQRKRDTINAEYTDALVRGVSWNGSRWTATNAGRDTLVELHEVAQQDGVNVTVLDANGAAHVLSAADFEGLRAAGRSYRQQPREHRLSVLQKVGAASAVTDVEAVDETAGWPV